MCVFNNDTQVRWRLVAHFLNQLKRYKMKGKAGMLAAIAMAMASGYDNQYGRFIDLKPSESLEERELRLKAAYEKQMKAKGLTEFFYGEHKVWALNQKSADKKALKKGYLTN
jgi:hypothetical protein